MLARDRRLVAGLLLLAAFVVSRGSPAMSGDAPYYVAVAHSLAHDRNLDLRNELDGSGGYPFSREARTSYARAGRAGELFPSQGIGLSLGLTPVYLTLDALFRAIPEPWLARLRWNRARAVRDGLSMVMAGLAAWLVALTLRLDRRLRGPNARFRILLPLAFVTLPLVFASIRVGPEIPAGLAVAWFMLEQTRDRPRALLASVPLALLPWLHLRYALLAAAGLVWLLRSGPRAAALPVLSFGLFGAVNWRLFGSVWPPAFPDLPDLTLWRWVSQLPATLTAPDAGLLWVAPFWLVAIVGARRTRLHPGYAPFVWSGLAGLVLLADVFQNGQPLQSSGLLLAPVLPTVAPLVAAGMITLTSAWGRRVAYAAMAWAAFYTLMVVHNPRQLLAEPGKGLGSLPVRVVASVRALNSPSARLARRGWTADDASFLKAVRDGDVEATGLFLAAGINPNHGLVAAVEAGRPETLALLLSGSGLSGAEAALALAHALDRSRQDLTGVFTAATITLDSPDPAGETALMAAIRRHRDDERTLLLRSGASVNAVSRSGQSALMIAVESSQPLVARQLIAAGAQVDLADLDGWTPLLAAARFGRAAEARMLLGAGANANVRSRIGWTALMWAAHEGALEIADALLAAGADPNASSLAGHTPLIRAAGEGHIEVVLRLLEAGADPRALVGGSSARDWAVRNGHTAVAAMLERAEHQ